jgi:anti-sigma B factor antagonist
VARGSLEIRSAPATGGGRVVAVAGELDLIAATALERELRRLEAQRPETIVLDLSGLTFLDSSGVELVLRAETRAGACGHALRVRRAPCEVHRVFEITCTEHAVSFVD